MALRPIQNSGVPAQIQESAAHVTDGTSKTIQVASSSQKEAGKMRRPARSEPDAATKVPDAGPDLKARLAENKMQADLRASELKSQLNGPDTAANFMDYTDDDCMS